MTTEQARFEIRRDSAAGWLAVNPVLLAGEPGFEEDTGKHKIGDGATAWSALPYFIDETVLRGTYVEQAKAGPFLVGTFGGDADETLSLYRSADGKTFQPFASNIYAPAPGFRDPSLTFINGTFFCAYTAESISSPTGTSFRVASSTDLLTWVDIATVDCTAATVAAGGTASVWAPDFFVDSDGTVYLTISVNAVAFYWTKATNSALTAWTTPALLGVAGVTTGIDANVYKVGATYHLHYKDNATLKLKHFTSSSPTSGYALEGTITQWSAPAMPSVGPEGPSIIQLGPARWRMYLDPEQHGLYYAESTDPTLAAASWSALTQATVVGRPFTARHGWVLPLAGISDAATMLAASTPAGGGNVAEGLNSLGAASIDSAGAFVDLGLARSPVTLDGVKVGQRVAIAASWYYGPGAIKILGTFATMNGATPVNYVCSGNGTPNTGGIPSLAVQASSSDYIGVGCFITYTLKAADIVNGSVTFHPYLATSGGARQFFSPLGYDAKISVWLIG